MVDTVSAQPLPQNSGNSAVVQKLEPGTVLQAKVEANLPGGVVRLAAADAKIDLRIPSPLPVGTDVNVTVSGSKQQPEIQLAIVRSPSVTASQPQQSPQGQSSSSTTGQLIQRSELPLSANTTGISPSSVKPAPVLTHQVQVQAEGAQSPKQGEGSTVQPAGGAAAPGGRTSVPGGQLPNVSPVRGAPTSTPSSNVPSPGGPVAPSTTASGPAPASGQVPLQGTTPTPGASSAGGTEFAVNAPSRPPPQSAGAGNLPIQTSTTRPAVSGEAVLRQGADPAGTLKPHAVQSATQPTSTRPPPVVSSTGSAAAPTTSAPSNVAGTGPVAAQIGSVGSPTLPGEQQQARASQPSPIPQSSAPASGQKTFMEQQTSGTLSTARPSSGAPGPAQPTPPTGQAINPPPLPGMNAQSTLGTGNLAGAVTVPGGTSQPAGGTGQSLAGQAPATPSLPGNQVTQSGSAQAAQTSAQGLKQGTAPVNSTVTNASATLGTQAAVRSIASDGALPRAIPAQPYPTTTTAAAANSSASGKTVGTARTPAQQVAQVLTQPLSEQQSGLGNLFSQIGSLTAAHATGKVSLPDPVVKAMQQILGLRLNSAQTLTGREIQQSVRLTGQFREAFLTQPGGGSQAGLPDLKSALLSLKSLLQQFGAKTQIARPASQPAVPSRQGSPQGQAQQSASGLVAQAGQQNLQSLLKETDTALARIRMTQLVNSGLAVEEGPQSSTRPMDIVLELPLSLGQETAVMQMQIGRDGSGNTGEEEGEPAWRLRFALDLTATGPLEAAISLRGGGTFASLWVDRKETYDNLNAQRETIEAAFADAGLDLQEFRLIRGLPPKTAARYGAVIDRQS